MPLQNEPSPAAAKADPAATQISMRSEFQRKMIHLSSFGIPILYSLLPKSTMLWLLVPATVLGLVIEYLRVRSEPVDRVIQKLFGGMLRSHERRGGKARVSGATWVLLSATICILLFPKVVMITGFVVLIVSDTVAALIGRRFGRHRFLEKSVEGSSAFAVSAILMVIIVALLFHAPWQFIAAGAVASVVAAVVEAMSYGVNIDDNLTIPTSFSVVMWGLLFLFFKTPAIDALLHLP
ncbi:MAG: Dolichol kinase [Chlorobi bacterium]|nr:Dolichol kinase [Chlorobiota bacterium]